MGKNVFFYCIYFFFLFFSFLPNHYNSNMSSLFHSLHFNQTFNFTLFLLYFTSFHSSTKHRLKFWFVASVLMIFQFVEDILSIKVVALSSEYLFWVRDSMTQFFVPCLILKMIMGQNKKDDDGQNKNINSCNSFEDHVPLFNYSLNSNHIANKTGSQKEN